MLRAERVKEAVVSITFVGPAGIRSLNHQHLGHDRVTDVIAFSLPVAGSRLPVADVYICPAVAARNAAEAGVRVTEELRRLVVHGVLHVLGYDHPAGTARMTSAMWRRQERYLRRFAT